jgi:hypothetical protein
MKKKTISSLFLISTIAAVAITFSLLGKRTVEYTDRNYTWYVDYNEKSDDIFIKTARKPRAFKLGDEWPPGAKPEFYLA